MNVFDVSYNFLYIIVLTCKREKPPSRGRIANKPDYDYDYDYEIALEPLV